MKTNITFLKTRGACGSSLPAPSIKSSRQAKVMFLQRKLSAASLHDLPLWPGFFHKRRLLHLGFLKTFPGTEVNCDSSFNPVEKWAASLFGDHCLKSWNPSRGAPSRSKLCCKTAYLIADSCTDSHNAVCWLAVSHR